MRLKTPTQDETWVMQDGRKILVGDMTEEHVKNVLRMLLRKERIAVEAEYRRRFQRKAPKNFYENMLPSYTKGVI